MQMTTFNVGDEIEWNDSHTCIITRIEMEGRLQRIYGTWRTLRRGTVMDPSFFLYSDRYMRLVQPQMMQYDPTQQGDTDEDI